ncbi:MAG TPA: gluconate 2-dehydrogenase subunit 3 family protein [Bryobacteraceae bacterium]|nr:gluconate 2-dehydrogenase subunit 3 family protein [Bryobacteraceae bacterium]
MIGENKPGENELGENVPAENERPVTISRRSVLATAALVPVTALTGAAQGATGALSAEERRTLDAFVDRIAPKDELGPGALEMGAAEYIDRSLADYLAPEKASIAEGLAAMNAFAQASQSAAFADLSPEKKDAVLTAMESGMAAGFGGDARGFFNRIRRLTLEGMFCDPYYGGNRNFGGWELIRYPGPRLATGPEDQRMSALPKPLHQSAYGSDHGH